ncbi:MULTISPECIES: diguanylate cyclase [unclassified Rhizobium]|uniref:GGDEF domain-containing response regulator n=1 Tax=unclassified Rhizobium TaxID=2613769 RepID=UPI0002716C44|nr:MULTISPECIES: diguanylate cyclase [unclassified Rhizobium]EJL58239.1 diguanylate cyclase (GGDEF) domain-containing protein [Rhizobium sp. CF122]MBB3397497.1 diguanylate cyclase (GGDEF)-like protein [Rhizobium sp. BK060]MBB4169810.1 diguanylate cyclase (GGDEF)-like protein [Rhizobium sp. BK538]TCM70670.1 response regulator receiver modulated diguanylate cyclase [Rhizobium sp. BK068]
MAFQEDLHRDGAGPRFGGQWVLLVEDSRMFSAVLCHRLHAELGLNVKPCSSLKVLNETIAQSPSDYTMAIVDLNLPDAPYGEALDCTIQAGIPAIVFTATFDLDTRNRIMERNVIDYVLKDNEFALDNVVASVRRVLSNRKTRVLVVDDVDSARQVLVGLLEAQQYVVVEAASGLEAFAALEAYDDIEVVVTDHHMPDMSGYELTRRIRRRFGSDRLRIIGVSSSSDRMLSVSFLKAGASDFLYRPFVAEELQCRIANNVETLTQLKQLRAAAACDYLTGLYNRRYFYDLGPKLVNDCLRQKATAAVAVLDIDHFKRLNDTYGHEIGDEVLKAVANRLGTIFEGDDNLLSRLGGEEFAILFPMMDSIAASKLCDEIRSDISRLKVMADDEELSVTVSIGVAEISGYETFDNYLNAADQFLYMAKHKGRNQVYSDARMTEEAAQ